jgi:hypothetical protein
LKGILDYLADFLGEIKLTSWPVYLVRFVILKVESEIGAGLGLAPFVFAVRGCALG